MVSCVFSIALIGAADAAHDKIEYDSSDPKHIMWNELEPGKPYQALKGFEIMTLPRSNFLGPYYVRAGAIIRIYEIDRDDPNEPWHKMKWLSPGVFEEDHIHGWINARDLEGHRAYEMP